MDPPGPFLVGPKGSTWPPEMLDTMFNLVQPVFNPYGAAKTINGQILPNMAKNGLFGGSVRPLGPFLMGLKGLNWSLHM